MALAASLPTLLGLPEVGQGRPSCILGIPSVPRALSHPLLSSSVLCSFMRRGWALAK